jgi:pilus assembly protein CpaB
MRLSSILMFVLAVLFAGAAGIVAQFWLEQQRRAVQPASIQTKEISTGRIVAAAEPLRFGSDLNAKSLREIEWPSSNIPSGAFASIDELLKGSERRVVLSAIEVNEPILKWKITGPGQRASLSAIIDNAMKAVTIRVNDVFGVAGFVLPGDRVDVLMTRTGSQNGDDAKTSFTDVLLQHVRVLGIDQLADDKSERASVVKAVTLEVKTEDAQKLALASTVGSLSLALRPAGSTEKARAHRVTASELGTPPVQVASAAPAAQEPEKFEAEPPRLVGVTRAIKRTEYNVTPDALVEGRPLSVRIR